MVAVTPTGGVNPNWPVTLDRALFNAAGYNGGVWAATGWTDLSHRTRGGQSFTRGRTYEIDEVRTGQLTAVWSNTDGALDPSNTSSPFAPDVLPYRPYQRLLQWPPSVNLLTADQATGGEGTPLAPGTFLSSVPGMYSDYDAFAQAALSALAWQGTQVWQCTIPASPTAGMAIVGVSPIAWQAASTGSASYSFSIRARCTTPGVNPVAAVQVRAFTTAGAVAATLQSAPMTLAGGTSSGWTQLSLSLTPAAGIAADVRLILLSSPPGTFVMHTDGLQWEPNPAPTAFAVPGTWYPQFTGMIERYPQTWTMNGGVYGLVSPTVVDVFAQLSQRQMQDPFIEQVLSLRPRFFYPLADGNTTATTFADASANFPPATIGQSSSGSGTIAQGSSVTSTGTNGGIGGITGTVATYTNPNYGSESGGDGSFIQLASAGIKGPPSGAWTRMIAFQAPTVPASGHSPSLWSSATLGIGPGSNQSQIYLNIGSQIINGGLEIGINDSSANNQIIIDTPVNLCDGNWHLVLFSLSANGRTLTLWVDNTTYTGTATADCHTSGIASESVGSFYFPWYGLCFENFSGDIAHVAEFDFAVTNTQATALYTCWRTGFSGDSSGTRYGRILTWAGYNGPTALDTGLTSNMGPATDIAGSDALTGLNAVVDTENGSHFVSRSGTVTFRQRSARYNQLTPVYIFGEQVANGEYPYEAVAFDWDPTRLATVAQITQYPTSQLWQYPPTFSSTAQSVYGQYVLTRTINSNDSNECLSAAQYLVGRLQNPLLRLETIKLHPSAFPPLWPVCLALELGTRVRVMRRPPVAPVIQFDGFVEQIASSWDDHGECTYTLQISPADLHQYWLLGALHGSLKSQAVNSQPQITCKPLADFATNPFAGSICNGQQITLDPGTALAETLTVHSVQATSPGYTSATITFATNLTYTHAANAAWCEALPAGDSNPATWDSVSILGTTTVLAY